MNLTPVSFLIVCPMLFLAGFVDAIGGGGGLISLPAYLFAGLPVHQAIATNKLSSACGTSLSVIRFLRNGLVNLKLALPAVAAAFAGSSMGARLSLAVSEDAMKYTLFIVLPAAAFVVLNRHLFGDGGGEAKADRRTVVVCILSALVIGAYDGFYGPGTGTFLIIAFTVLAKMSVPAANAQAKVINLTSNITSLAVFLLNGQVVLLLGLAGAVCNMAGNWLGSGLAITKGAKIVRPVILIVLVLLLIKILTGF
ncbi:MAG: TSUP family transporter [Clostridiales bacterium]|nr:TSUP family transporter [Clostridiales bacterium]